MPESYANKSYANIVCQHTSSREAKLVAKQAKLHATKPNEILNFDFMYIGLSRDWKYQYLLLLKDDLSGYLWLVPCRTADAAAIADALMPWFAVFGVVLL
jgi:hypothetical protein